MAHFAQIDSNNIVLQVIVVGDQDCLDSNGNESESIGIKFCKSLFGQETNWIQTSYNRNFRKNYAGNGYTYNEIRDAFIPPKQYPSWILNEDACTWEPPIPYPDDGNLYFWNEDTQSWLE
jgi:hypothetical protein